MKRESKKKATSMTNAWLNAWTRKPPAKASGAEVLPSPPAKGRSAALELISISETVDRRPDKTDLARRTSGTFGSPRHIMLGLIVSIIVVGLIAGALARLVVPGRHLTVHGFDVLVVLTATAAWNQCSRRLAAH